MSTTRAWFQGRPASRLILGIGGTLIAAVTVVAAYAIWQLRAQALEAGRASLEDQAFSLAAHASQALAAADLVLTSVEQMATDPVLPDAAAYKARLATREVHEQLRARHLAFQAIDVVSVVDAQGRLTASSRRFPVSPLPLGDREAFIAPMRPGSPEPYVSLPVRNRFNGTWTLYLSRRIESPSGDALGVVMVGLSVQALSDFYTVMRPDRRATAPGASVTPRTATSLLRSDLTVMARAPHDDDAIGRRMPRTGPYRRVVVDDEAATLLPLPQEVFEPWEAQPANRAHVLFAHQPIGGFPLSVAVAADEDVYLAPWKRQALAVAGFAAAAVVFMAMALLILARSLSRREQQMAESARLREAADAASRAKSDFLATMSHEIRTPMNGIIGTADLLARSELGEHERQLADTMLRSSRTLLSIINDILDLSKIEAGELQLSAAPFRIRAVASGLIDLFGHYAQSRGLSLVIDVDDRVPGVLDGDAARLRQVLVNLVGNAIKFSHAGTVRVSMRCLGSPDAQCELRVEVQDNGVGISAEARPHVFRPFAQADASVGKRFGGTGLGLAIAKQLVRLMGGRIDFVSEPGFGTTFWFEVRLPVADDAAVPDSGDAKAGASPHFTDSGSAPLTGAAPAPVQPPQLAGHLLVMEDNAVNALVVEAQLATMGCSCEVAVDGEEALRCLRENTYDAVLMDCMLPGLSGHQVTRQWRTEEMRGGGKGRLPIIALTANALSSNVDQCAASGMDDYLTKPCTVEKLAGKLSRWLPMAET